LFNVADKELFGLKPQKISDDKFKEDLEKIIGSADYHSDEISETDIDQSQDEIRIGIRPSNRDESDNHVLHVYDKPWRSKRVSKA
jgi:hypothetical protein